MQTITDKLADALRNIVDGRFQLIDALKQSNHGEPARMAWHEFLDDASKALAEYDATQAQSANGHARGLL